MKYLIKTHKRVDKFLSKHPEISPQFFDKFENISNSPFENTCDIKSIKGENNTYRLRIGKYRFLYRIYQAEIHIYIYDADSQGDIY